MGRKRPRLQLAGDAPLYKLIVEVRSHQSSCGALRFRRSQLKRLLGSQALAVVDAAERGARIQVQDEGGDTTWRGRLLVAVGASGTSASGTPSRRYELRGLGAWFQRQGLRAGARVAVRRLACGALQLQAAGEEAEAEGKGMGLGGGSVPQPTGNAGAAAGGPSVGAVCDAGDKLRPLQQQKQELFGGLGQAPGKVEAVGDGQQGAGVGDTEPQAVSAPGRESGDTELVQQRAPKRQRTVGPQPEPPLKQVGEHRERALQPGVVAVEAAAGQGSRGQGGVQGGQPYHWDEAAGCRGQHGGGSEGGGGLHGHADGVQGADIGRRANEGRAEGQGEQFAFAVGPMTWCKCVRYQVHTGPYRQRAAACAQFSSTPIRFWIALRYSHAVRKSSATSCPCSV